MNHKWKRFVAGSLCLATLLLASGPPLTSHAAARLPRLPQSPAYCAPKEPEDIGISYVSDSNVSVSYPSFYAILDPLYSTEVPLFNYAFSSPGIGAWLCQSGDILLLTDDDYPLYHVEISAPGWSTVSSYSSSVAVYPGEIYAIDLGVLPASSTKQYVFNVQGCDNDSVGMPTACSIFSPPLLLTAASNSNCQNGYVWRQAFSFDHVCVQPWEAAQAAYDNSQNLNRGNPAFDNPIACNPGYVWREAWGGDYVCVDPPQRDQVLSDNSQALNRMVSV